MHVNISMHDVIDLKATLMFFSDIQKFDVSSSREDRPSEHLALQEIIVVKPADVRQTAPPLIAPLLFPALTIIIKYFNTLKRCELLSYFVCITQLGTSDHLTSIRFISALTLIYAEYLFTFI